jgi:hypothetical protein
MLLVGIRVLHIYKNKIGFATRAQSWLIHKKATIAEYFHKKCAIGLA